jgi:methionine-rich copper-binding protein CopC
MDADVFSVCAATTIDDRQADIRQVMMKRFTCVFASLLTMAAAFETGAHAFLDHATPAVGSAIHGSPAQVRLWFTQELEPTFSTVQVQDRDGRRVDNQDKHVDPANPALLQVTLPPLAAGSYRVVWRALSVDTHVTEGDFTFDVLP